VHDQFLWPLVTHPESRGLSWPANEQLDAESVVYDRAIRFQRQDGSSFCIACQLNGPGIATEVHVSDEEETIADLLGGCTLRVSIP
jgi:hypothetical protein